MSKQFITTFYLNHKLTDNELAKIFQEWPQLFGEDLEPIQITQMTKDISSFFGLTIETEIHAAVLKFFLHEYIDVDSDINPDWVCNRLSELIGLQSNS